MDESNPSKSELTETLQAMRRVADEMRFERFQALCRETVSPLMLEPWTHFDPAEIPGHPEIEAYRNSRYQVTVRRYVDPDLGACAHLSIKMHDKCAGHDWRDFQLIKNEILGEEQEAVEIYPAESRLADGANQFHLWCAIDKRVPFGFRERLVTEQPIQAVAGGPASRQRPFDVPPKSIQETVFLDGNPQNFDPSNIRIITKEKKP